MDLDAELVDPELSNIQDLIQQLLYNVRESYLKNDETSYVKGCKQLHLTCNTSKSSQQICKLFDDPPKYTDNDGKVQESHSEYKEVLTKCGSNAFGSPMLPPIKWFAQITFHWDHNQLKYKQVLCSFSVRPLPFYGILYKNFFDTVLESIMKKTHISHINGSQQDGIFNFKFRMSKFVRRQETTKKDRTAIIIDSLTDALSQIHNTINTSSVQLDKNFMFIAHFS